MSNLAAILKKNQPDFFPVVPFDPKKDKLLPLDLTAANPALTEDIISDDTAFEAFIGRSLLASGSRYGIGGYDEHRTVYSRSTLFDGAGTLPRRLHLGTDIWGEAGTPVYAFLGGRVHSFAFNDHRGDYGATLILLHQLEGYAFHTLYGHISLADIATLTESQYVVRGQQVASFGSFAENGQWPPHLHFQVIEDMQLKKGDYPGVCTYADKEKYLDNCPDPDLILQLNRYTGG